MSTRRTSKAALSVTDERRLKVGALFEKKKRQELIDAMRADSFPEQLAFIDDPAKLKAALTTRRAGKSMADAMYLLMEGIKNPGVSMLYTGLTDDTALRIIWKDCLKTLGKRYGISLRLTKGAMSVTLTDYGSVIYILGIDGGPEEMAKALGQKFKLCVVDEGAKYKQDTKALIYEVLLPGVGDYGGTIAFTGMPDNNVRSFFFEVTSGLEPGWSVHTWTQLQNPYMREQAEEQIAFFQAQNPAFMETATYRQQWLGQWVVDQSALVYRFAPELWVEELPKADNWHYVLGVDLGYDPDPSAFVLLAYRDYDPNLYVVEAHKGLRMTLQDVAMRIKHYGRYFNPERNVVDNAHKQAVEELKQRYSINVTPADKAGKADFIQLVNNDMQCRRVKFLRNHAEPLAVEMQSHSWDEKQRAKGVMVERRRSVNHCCDAFLYAWRDCYNWVDRGVQVDPIKDAEQQVAEFWRIQDERSMRGGVNELEREYGYVQ